MFGKDLFSRNNKLMKAKKFAVDYGMPDYKMDEFEEGYLKRVKAGDSYEESVIYGIGYADPYFEYGNTDKLMDVWE